MINTLNQYYLFEDQDMIPLHRSVSDNQDTILQSIIDLYIPAGRFDIDPCYNRGGFYKSGVIKKPDFYFDINPMLDYDPGIKKHDCRKLPFKNESINSIVFDPPFIDYPGKNLINAMNLFSAFKNYGELKKMYSDSFIEFHRILKPGRILVVKCQDGSHGKRFISTHIDAVILPCREIGYYEEDIFILTARHRIENRKFKQMHARKYHCYFIVMRKR